MHERGALALSAHTHACARATGIHELARGCSARRPAASAWPPFSASKTLPLGARSTHLPVLPRTDCSNQASSTCSPHHSAPGARHHPDQPPRGDPRRATLGRPHATGPPRATPGSGRRRTPKTAHARRALPKPDRTRPVDAHAPRTPLPRPPRLQAPLLQRRSSTTVRSCQSTLCTTTQSTTSASSGHFGGEAGGAGTTPCRVPASGHLVVARRRGCPRARPGRRARGCWPHQGPPHRHSGGRPPVKTASPLPPTRPPAPQV